MGTFKHALLKAKGEGTTIEEILNPFLLSCRTIPNPTVKNGMSPVEALIGRKLWTTLDALCPQKQRQDASQNKTKPFLIGPPVFVKNDRPIQPNLLPDTKMDSRYQNGFQVPDTGKKDFLSIT